MHLGLWLLQQRIPAPFQMLPKASSDIIREASKSPLGVLSLIVLILGSVAVTFFREATQSVRVAIYLLMFAGAVAYGIAIIRVPKQVPQYAGYILDTETSKPVEGASVALDVDGTPHVRSSDSNGAFFFKVQDPTEVQDIRVDKQDYRHYEVQLRGDPSLIPQPIRLAPVTTKPETQPKQQNTHQAPSRGYADAASVSFHTDSHSKRAETLVEVFVEDKTGRVLASIADAFQRFDKNSDYGPVKLRFDKGLDSIIAKSAHCRIHILNPKGVTQDDLWSFNYEINLHFSNDETLRCSEMNVHLQTLGNQWSDPTGVTNR
jgi:hypothetical protein